VDVTIQAQILELVEGVTLRLNVALIIITHNLGVVARYARRGERHVCRRIVEAGSAEAIYHDPGIPTRWRCCGPCRGSTSRGGPASIPSMDSRRTDQARWRMCLPPALPFCHRQVRTGKSVLAPTGEAEHSAACFRSAELAAARDVAA